MGEIAKLNYSHDAMVDLIVQNPGISQGKLAAMFGYTQGWVCQIMASDAFQARLAARRNEIVDPVLTATVEERFRGVMIKGLSVLQEKLDQPNCADGTALKAVELSSRALGYGAQDTSKPPQAPGLEKLAENITMIFNQKRGELTHEKTIIEADAALVTNSDKTA